MPAQLSELDEHTPFGAQLAAAGSDPVVLINKFTVPSEDSVEAFAAGWAAASEVMKRQPGFVSTQLHRGTAGSRTLVNVAVWESARALRAAVSHPDFQATHGGYPDGTTSSPHVFQKVAVPGICEG